MLPGYQAGHQDGARYGDTVWNVREYRLICYKDDDDEVFIGRDLAHAHSYSEGIASAIDVEVKRIIDESYEKAKTIIAEHRDVLDRCAALLLRKKKTTREEFEALFEA